MAERKLTKSELRMKKNNPKRFAELQKIRARRGRGSLTSKTIRDAGQGKGKAAKTAMEKRADQAGKKATRQALQKGASAAKAKQAGNKAAMAIVGGSNIKTAINLGMVAANVLPVGKAIRGVKGLRSLIKGGSKSKAPSKSTVKKTSESPTTTTKQRTKEATKGTPSKSNTPFRSRRGNENKSQKDLEGTPKPKLGPSSYTPPQSKALTVIPKKTKVPKLSSNQKSAIKATAAVPAVLGANALLTNKPTPVKKPKPTPVKKPKPTPVKKPKPTPVKKKKPDLSYRDDEGSPIGTEDKKRTIKSKPKKRKTVGEAMFSSDQTPRNQTVKNPFTGNDMTIDYSDNYEMKMGGKVRRRMGGKVRGYGKAQRGY